MKLFVYFITLLIVSITVPQDVSAKDEGKINFEKTYGGKGYDYGGALINTSDGGFLIVGNEDTDENYTGLYLLKVDENGEKQWEKTDFSGRHAYSVIEGHNGGFIVAGAKKFYGEKIEMKIYLSYIDDQGNKIWGKTYEGDGTGTTNSIDKTKDGYIFFGSKYIEGKQTAYVLKLNKEGEQVWDKTFSTYNGRTILFGTTGIVSNNGGIVTTVVTKKGENIRTLLLKLNEHGEVMWGKVLDGETPFSLMQNKKGNYMVLSSKGMYQRNILLEEVSQDGKLMMSKVLSSKYTYDALDFQPASFVELNSGYIIVGQFSTLSMQRGHVVYVNKQGEIIWEKKVGKTRTRFRDVAKLNDDEVFITGATLGIEKEDDLLVVGVSKSSIDRIKVYLNGKQQEVSPSPEVINNRTMIPLRSIFEKLGLAVSWDNKTKSISIESEEIKIQLKVHANEAYITKNGIDRKVILESVPQIINGSTMVPLRFIAQAISAKVEWESSSKSVRIIYP